MGGQNIENCPVINVVKEFWIYRGLL